MFRWLRHWAGSIADRQAVPRESTAHNAAGDDSRPATPNPLLRIRRTVLDMAAAVEQQRDTLCCVEDGLRGIEDQVALVWREREALTQDYYAVLRGVLGVLDDCLALGADPAGLPLVRMALERILQEQSLEPIPAAVGERFQSDTQCCEQTAASTVVPPGTVLQVLAVGYRRRRADGTTVVVRPARVVVSRAASETEESDA